MADPRHDDRTGVPPPAAEAVKRNEASEARAGMPPPGSAITARLRWAAVLAVLCAVFFGWRAYRAEYSAIIDGLRAETRAAAGSVDSMLDGLVKTFDAEVPRMESFLSERPRTDDEITEYLRDRTRWLSTSVDPMYVDLYCGYRGRYLCGNYWRAPAGFDITVRPWYVKALAANGRSAVVQPYTPADYPHEMMAVSRRLRHPDTVLSLDVQLSAFEPIAGRVPGGRGGFEFFLTPDGSIVSPTADVAFRERELADVVAAVRASEEPVIVHGDQYVFHSRSKQSWLAIRMHNRSEVLDSARWAATVPVLWSVFGFVVVFLLAEWLSYRRDFAARRPPSVSRRGRIAMPLVYASVSAVFLAFLWYALDSVLALETRLAVSRAEADVGRQVSRYVAFVETARGAAGYCSRHIERMTLAGADDAAVAAETKTLVGIYRSMSGRNYRNIYVARPGWYVDSMGWRPPAGYDPADRDFYREAVANPNDNIFTRPYASEIDGTEQITISRAVNDDMKTVVGIDISVKMLQTMVCDLGLEGACCAMVIAADGFVVERHEIGAEAKCRPVLDERALVERALTESGSFRFSDSAGRALLVVSVPLPIGGRAIVIGDRRMLDASLAGYRARTLVMAGVMFLVGCLFVYVLIRRVRRERERELVLGERSRQSEALSEALDLAEAANRAKGVFLSSMSHDIRTPMNAIIGFTDLALRHQDDPERVRHCLRKISQSSDHLLTLISEVLDMSRIEAGKMTLESGRVDIGEVLASIDDLFTPQAREKRVGFSVSREKIEHPLVVSDRTRLTEVLMNLVSNAVKFTPEGGSVVVMVRETPSARPGRSCYLFVVRDNGIGMSEEFARRIFEPFSREQTTTISGVEGAGLGMAITKRIVDTMAGTIGVDTAPGRGTRVEVELEFARFQEPETRTAVPADESTGPDLDTADLGSGCRILLVDDNEINREIAMEILTEHGYEVDCAANGAEAVDKVCLPQSRRSAYDLILMDIQMPVMNGYEAARAIRAWEADRKSEDSDSRCPPPPGLSTASRVPIIALSANAFEEDLKASLAAGMDAHLSKPVKVVPLLTAIVKYTGKNGSVQGR